MLILVHVHGPTVHVQSTLPVMIRVVRATVIITGRGAGVIFIAGVIT